MIADLLQFGHDVNVGIFHLFNDVQDNFFIKLAVFMCAITKYTVFPAYIILLAIIVKKAGRNVKQVMAPIIISYVIYIIWVGGLKHLLHIPRPFLKLPEGSVHVLDKVKNAEDPFASLPSGHAGISMLFLVALWPMLNKAGKIFGVFLTLYIGFARIELGLHMPSDILLTWIASFCITYFSLKISREFLARQKAASA